MSYEGTEEYICENKHYWALDALFEAWQENGQLCPHCGAPVKWQHSIDETNGICDEALDATTPAPTKEVGFEDDWHEDHYKNKYATKIFLVEPDSSAWKLYHGDTEKPSAV